MQRRTPDLITLLCLAVAGLLWISLPNGGENPERPEAAGEMDEQENAHLAFEQNFEMTKDPALGYPPVGRKIEAYRYLRTMQQQRLASESAIPGVEWTERGSDNVGGRTRTIMFDPTDPEAKKVWAGSIGGGLWMMEDITDAAGVWQNVEGIMDNLAISTLAYDPTENTTFYLGTGLGFTGDIRGEGIWKSTDAGTTWNQLASTETSSFHWVQRIQVTGNGTVLAATRSGLQRSTDGGDSWTVPLSGRIADIEIGRNGVIYASTGVNSPGQVFRSNDDGQSWTDITPQEGGRRIEIAVAPSDANTIYAVADGGSGTQDIEWFQKSINGGTTWTSVAIPRQLNQNCTVSASFFTRGQAFFDLIIGVHPENPDLVIAGGIDLHRSMDGGDTWEPISYWTGSNDCDEFVHADQHEITFRPGFPNEALFGSDGGVDYSRNLSDENPDFDRRVRGYNTMLYYAMAMVNEPGSNVMLAGAQDNGTQRYSEPGLNSTHMVAGGDGAYCFIDQANPDIQISSFVFNVYRVSTNGGKSFRVISGDQSSGRFINPSDYDDEQAMLFSAGNSNQIKRITDIRGIPGAQETIELVIGGGQISNIKISPNQPKRLFVGTGNGEIYRIDSTHLTNMVSTPMNGTFEGSPGSFVSSIDVGETDDHLLITFSNYGSTSVYETTDGGVTWESREGNLPDMPVRWGLFNPDNRREVLLATEMGVWSTTQFNEASPTWEPSNSGLATVRTDMLKYRAADKLVGAATHGRGVFTSSIFANSSIADFTTDRKVAYAGKPITFIDASQAAGGSFAWDFGDGNSSTDQNPSHTYTTPGTYTVSLGVNSNESVETKTDFITVLPAKSTPYAPSDGGDFESNPDDYTTASLLHDEITWERGAPSGTLNLPSSGDNVWKTGLSSTISNLGFDHRSALYTPAFDLSETDRDYTLKFNLSSQTRACFSPVGMFMQFSLDGGLNWQTLGSSRRSVGDLNWYNRGDNLDCAVDFDISEDKMGWTASSTDGDFNIPVQTKLNHLAGNDHVAFRLVVSVLGNGASSGYGLDGFMIDDFEISATGPTADFEADRTVTPVGGEIQFSYASKGADSFMWDFGDGNTSTEMNPTHSYTAGGLYTVSLTVMDNGTPITETKDEFINVISSKELPYLLSDGGDFETNQNDFIANNVAGTGWELGVSEVAGKSGTASGAHAWVTGLNDAQYADDSRAELITPTFIFDQEKVYTLEFKANYSFEDNWDGFIVEYTTDQGDTWIKLNEAIEPNWYNQITDPQAVFGASVPIFSGNTSGSFETFFTDVSFLYPNPSVNFRFLFLSDANVIDAGVAIDDFQILVTDPEPPVADFEASVLTGCEGTTVTFTSLSTGTITDYQWDFGANASPRNAIGRGPHEVVYGSSGPNTVALRVSNDFNEESTESKINYIVMGANHTPSFTRENTDDVDIIRLTASAGDAYQWLLAGQPIDGATEQVYLATESGLYTVEVTIDGCAATATQQNIVTSLEDDKTFSNSVTVYPNPVQDELRIGISNEVMGSHTFKFYTSNGVLLSERELTKDQFEKIFEFDVSGFQPGNVLIQIVSPKGTTVKQIIKE